MAVAELPALAQRGVEREYRCRYCGRVFLIGAFPSGYFRIICPARQCKKAQTIQVAEFRRRMHG